MSEHEHGDDAGRAERMADEMTDSTRMEQGERPAAEDRAGWAAHWAARGQTWRTEPEIPTARQSELAERRATVADRDAGVFPFAGMALTRADIEWLLAAHEDGRGPVDWAAEREKKPEERRRGLDLRATDLSGLDLSGLPLAGLLAGPLAKRLRREDAELEEGDAGNTTLAGANLTGAHLEGAQLSQANLEGARLTRATLDEAFLVRANLASADLTGARLYKAYVFRAAMAGAVLREANLEWAIFGYNALKGADLRGVKLDRAYLNGCELEEADLRGVRFAGVRVPFAKLSRANLSGASFEGAIILVVLELQGADLTGISARGCTLKTWNCQEANLTGAHLEGATISKSNLQGATLTAAHLEGATLHDCELQGAILTGAHLAEARFVETTLAARRMRSTDYHQPDTYIPTDLSSADLSRATLTGLDLTRAILRDARLDVADLSRARLEGADLTGASCSATTLAAAHLEGTTLDRTALAGADLRHAICDASTTLRASILTDRAHGPARLAGVRWGGADLRQLDWATMPITGDEREARRGHLPDGKPKVRAERIAEHVDALRVYRQLALAVQDGPAEPQLNTMLNKTAVNYDYRAQLLQRRVHWLRRDYGRWAFATLLWALVGYGYRMGRILIAYAVALAIFTALYFAIGAVTGAPTSPQAALLTSVTAFHGRVFAGQFTLGTPQSWVAAAESITGLVIESVFIAMLTQRFFGK